MPYIAVLVTSSGSILALLGYKVNSLLTLSQNWFARKISRSYENEIILKFVDMDVMFTLRCVIRREVAR